MGDDSRCEASARSDRAAGPGNRQRPPPEPDHRHKLDQFGRREHTVERPPIRFEQIPGAIHLRVRQSHRQRAMRRPVSALIMEPAGASNAVAVALPGLPPGPAVLPSDRFADWLLWKVPALGGRIAYDTRFELLTDRELRELVRFKKVQPGWERAAAGYPIVVLDTTEGRGRAAVLLRQPGARTLYRDKRVVVIFRPAA